MSWYLDVRTGTARLLTVAAADGWPRSRYIALCCEEVVLAAPVARYEEIRRRHIVAPDTAA